ncbi:tetratricopeptide repeat protein [Edaphobacter bradus]|uniref:tetratricopeptide repeat protein n=1 Tax=Edaphobacter bradus TaxID=2259016 RepID=UPI0021DFEC8E|nr:tetratricopeptide repeat protein [Edaphobacter bradus]
MTVANRDTDVTRYSRQDVLRILHLHTRQIQAWERAGLISPKDTYSFEELGQFRILRDLQANTRISAKSIRASVDAMQRVAGMSNPLLEATAVRRGSRLSFRHAGAIVDPITQQLAFDFETSPSRQLQVVKPESLNPMQRTAELQEMFLRAVRLEEQPATIPEAIELYEAILETQPRHAPSLINLGTIHYNMRHFEKAEDLYRQATIADPEYALAFFDLGNVLDEMQQLTEATLAYQRAVALVPQYADAHYNLALAYERQGQKRRALRHWLTYVRLDPVGPWASHARDQARKILKSEKLSIVSRRGRLVKAAG